MDLRNSNSSELRSFYFTTAWKLFRKFSSEVEKCITWSSIQLLPNQVRIRLKILTYESPMQSYIKTE